jgi:hypothetical protein
MLLGRLVEEIEASRLYGRLKTGRARSVGFLVMGLLLPIVI